MIGFPGELFSKLRKDIKIKSQLKNTFVVNHAWRRPYQSRGYYADNASMARGGFGTNNAYLPGHLSKALVDVTRSMIRESSGWTFTGDGTATVGFGDSSLRSPGRTDGAAYDAVFVSSLGNFNARREATNSCGVQPAVTVNIGE